MDMRYNTLHTELQMTKHTHAFSFSLADTNAQEIHRGKKKIKMTKIYISERLREDARCRKFCRRILNHSINISLPYLFIYRRLKVC